jgi:cell division protein FtsB
MAESRSKPRPKQRRTGQLSGIQIMFAVILAVGLLLAINFSSRIAAGQDLFEAYDRVRQEIEVLKAEQSRLQQERDFVLNDAYVEEWARDRGKMILPGEKLIVPVPSGSIAEPTPIIMPLIEVQTGSPEPQPWELWWSLFFDSPPPRFES